jgi:hypothetical protein
LVLLAALRGSVSNLPDVFEQTWHDVVELGTGHHPTEFLQCNRDEHHDLLVGECVQRLAIGGIHPIRAVPWKLGDRQRDNRGCMRIDLDQNGEGTCECRRTLATDSWSMDSNP